MGGAHPTWVDFHAPVALMLLTTGSGKPARSSMTELGDGAPLLAIILSYRKSPWNAEDLPQTLSGRHLGNHEHATRNLTKRSQLGRTSTGLSWLDETKPTAQTSRATVFA